MTIYEEDLRYLAEAEVLNHLSNKVILITGGAGMIASYIVKVLLKFNRINQDKKCKIIAVCRNSQRVTGVYGDYLQSGDIEIIYCDVCDLKEVEGNIDIIIHAAGHTAPNFYISNPVDTCLVNTVGTNRLLELAIKKKVKSFLYISSASVYGDISSKVLKEDCAGIVNFFDYKNSYSESKRMGEHLCMSYYAQYNLPIKIVRPFHMYGPGVSKNNGNMFAGFISNIRNNENIVLKSKGVKYRNFCYLRDSILQIFYVLCLGKDGEIYNIGNPEATSTVKEFVETIINVVPEIKIEYHLNEQIIPSNNYDMIPDLSKIEKLIPKDKHTLLSMKEGVERWIFYEINTKGT